MKFITHDDPFKLTSKNHGEVEIAKGTLQFPQVETLAEAVEFFGGEEKLVDNLNDLLYSRPKAGALAIVRNAAADAKLDEVIAKAQDYSKSYNPAIERVSKAALLEGVDTLRQKKEEMRSMSQEELIALLESTLKI